MNLTRNGVTLQVDDDLAWRLMMARLVGDETQCARPRAAAIGDTMRSLGLEVKGIYAGLTLHENAPYQLILLPGDVEKTWEDAKAWAAEQGGVLPSRVDALVLFQNLRDKFQREAYWTDAPYVDDEGSAWYQDFGNGGQDYTRKSAKLRAVAVRRIAI